MHCIVNEREVVGGTAENKPSPRSLVLVLVPVQVLVMGGRRVVCFRVDCPNVPAPEKEEDVLIA